MVVWECISNDRRLFIAHQIKTRLFRLDDPESSSINTIIENHQLFEEFDRGMARSVFEAWSEIYYESVVERDRRLRLLARATPTVSYEDIVYADKKVPTFYNIYNCRMKQNLNVNDSLAYSNIIFLEKSTVKSKKLCVDVKKEVIYRRTEQDCTLMHDKPDVNPYNKKLYYKSNCKNEFETFRRLYINPRKRWYKLYDRNHPFSRTQDLLVDQICEGIQHSEIDRGYFEIGSDTVEIPAKYSMTCVKIRIYHRNQSKLCDDRHSLPSFWDEPDSSENVDAVSQLALSHITLLCRDVICECNRCTTGCSKLIDKNRICDACQLNWKEFLDEYFRWRDTISAMCGSFSEGCMLPTFYIFNDVYGTVKKRSDIDVMEELTITDPLQRDLLLCCDSRNSPPGYLKLRSIQTGGLLNMPDNKEKTCKYPPSKIETFYENYYDKVRIIIPHGPATLYVDRFRQERDWDVVYYIRWPYWPPVANSWIQRERKYNWPSKETIEKIVSMGCRIVHKPHPLTKATETNTEFRYSFSMAETVLFETLSLDQKKCFIAFKCLIKRAINKSETITKERTQMNTYHMKTLFLWTCEKTPHDEWKTETGWAKCLLYMIDRLCVCLKSQKLPSYFIPENNLFVTMGSTKPLVSELERLRKNPITYAAIFIDSTRNFHRSYFSISDEALILCDTDQTLKRLLKQQLVFLQKMVMRTEMRRTVSFWKKEAVLRIFAKWCDINSCKLNFTPWQCLTKEMSLFDVVYLDIVHEFRVPVNVLLEYVKNEWSVELIGKLAICYSNNTLIFWKNCGLTGYSFHIKTRQIVQFALQYRYVSADFIFSYITFLMNCREFDMASLVLTSVMVEIENCPSTVFFMQDCSFSDSFHNQKTGNEIQEISDILESIKTQHFYLDLPFAGRFLLISCYRYTDDEKNLHNLLEIINPVIKYMSSWKDSIEITRDSLDFPYAIYLAMLEVLENSTVWENCYCMVYQMFVSMKISLIHKKFEELQNECSQLDSRGVPKLYENSFCSCNDHMSKAMSKIVGIMKFAEKREWADAVIQLDYYSALSMRTTADKTYYSQFLVFAKEGEHAVSLLEDVVEQEGDYSLSVVIVSRQFWESSLLDETLGNELAKSSKEYIVFPTNIYARYILGIAYSSLGQEEQYKSNMTEIFILRQRYSEFPEWAPMLHIIGNILDGSMQKTRDLVGSSNAS